MFFHAFMARDRARMALTAMQLQLLKPEASGEVLRQLGWLPLIALQPGETVSGDFWTPPSGVCSSEWRLY
jgi:hypothetical protein